MSKVRKKDRIVNERSLFATKESVGAYWRAVKRGTNRYNSIKGQGAAQRSKAPTGIVVVNPRPA